MRLLYKSIFFGIVFSLSFLMTPTSQVGAITTGLPFGGYAQVTIPCTCSVGKMVIFRNLFTGIKSIPGGALYVPPGAKSYANFLTGAPTTWHLGSFVPGPSQAACLVGAPPACTPLPVNAVGIVTYAGTSFPSLGIFGF